MKRSWRATRTARRGRVPSSSPDGARGGAGPARAQCNMWCRRWSLLVVPALAGCASIVPPELVGQVDRQVTGADLLREPLRYVGRTILVRGEILLVHNIPQQT